LLFDSRDTMTGIDLGTRSVKLARAQGGKGSRKLLSAGLAELAGEGDWEEASAAALGKLLADLGLKPRDLGRVIVAVSGKSVHLRQVEMPALSETELKSSLRYEARQHLPLENFGEAALDCQVLAPPAPGAATQSVLMVGAPDELVKSRVKVLGAVGIEPEIVDAAPLALVNVLEASDPDALAPGRTVAILDIGASSSTFVFLRRGGVVYTRHVAAAAGGPVPALASAFRETANFYGQLNERRPVDQVVLAGGGALTPGFKEELARQLGLSVSVLDAARGLTYAPAKGHGIPAEDLAGLSPRLGVALGMLYWGDGSV
jgi:Tfp pilus assembly PilM family ATPase